MKSTRILFALAIFTCPAYAEEVTYERDIRPMLIAKCSACHGAIKQEAGLRLDAGELILRGGDNGEVLDRDEPQKSLLLERVASEDVDLRMPPEGEGERLKPEQIRLLTSWISSGAKYPVDEIIPTGPDSHWAYQSPVKIALPKVADADWASNPIDAFIFARLAEKGLQPAPAADQLTLLRRVYLDIIGLPPTPNEQQKFVNDSSSEAWLHVVNRLLEDPAYGERWGRHWMDVWRYSDWDGYKQELRGSQRHIWRWREWIVESLNADKPYDRMIIEMLAADEVSPADREALRATGYLARSYHKSNRDIWLDATVEHTAKAFLGMTIDCARCHDHKYDPIAQKEYFAMRAIFEPHNVRTERVPGETDLSKNGFVRAFDAKPNEPTYLYIGGNEKSPDKEHPITPAAPRIIDLPYDPQPIDLPPVAVLPALREFYEQEAIAAAQKKRDSARESLAKLDEPAAKDTAGRIAIEIAQQKLKVAEAELASVTARWKADKAKYGAAAGEQTIDELAASASLAERSVVLTKAQLSVSERQHALLKAEAATESDQAKKQAAIDKAKQELAKAKNDLAAAEDTFKKPNERKYASVGESYPGQSTGRRIAFANWITHQRNPLTARVAVNHIWLRHFGTPLVENIFDFGMRSPEPEHRKLLDWLAVDFMEHGWSMKRLHRLIVTSQYYRRASHVDPVQFAANHKLDPDNTLLWKANVRRLDAEVVRDAMLHIAGSLNRTMGGPDIDQAQGDMIPRRSLYFRHAYEKQMPLLVAFDAAAPGECYRRSESVVPQQALALANGPIAIEQSRLLAGKLNKASDGDEAFIRNAFAAVLCRDCTTDELGACSQFLASQSQLLTQPNKLKQFDAKTKVRRPPASDPALRARENLIHVLINHNDFVTVR